MGQLLVLTPVYINYHSCMTLEEARKLIANAPELENQRRSKGVSGTDKNLITPDQGPEFILYCSRLGTEPSHKL